MKNVYLQIIALIVLQIVGLAKVILIFVHPAMSEKHYKITNAFVIQNVKPAIKKQTIALSVRLKTKGRILFLNAPAFQIMYKFKKNA